MSSQRTFTTLEYQSWEKLCVPWFVRVLGFLQQVGLTFVSWHRGLFLVGKIFINVRILRDPFLVGIPSIKVSHGAQDIFLYIHAQVQARPSKVYLSPSASFCQLLISSMHSSCLIRGTPVGLEVEPSTLWCRLWMHKQGRWVHQVRQLCLEFIKLLELPLSNCIHVA